MKQRKSTGLRGKSHQEAHEQLGREEDVEIQRKTFNQIISRARREIGVTLSLESQAVIILQKATEEYMVDPFREANLCCQFRGAKTLKMEDLDVVLAIRTIQEKYIQQKERIIENAIKTNL